MIYMYIYIYIYISKVIKKLNGNDVFNINPDTLLHTFSIHMIVEKHPEKNK